jgi:CPA2 family monovalent cation:H+ antiporter-2
MVVSQSSTAIVLRALSDRHELNAPHGRLITGALLFQDLSVVPMLVLLPVLGGGLATVSPREALGAVAESAAILGATWIGGRRLVPRYFRSLARAEGNDVFLLSLGALLMASCWLSAKAGLSTALGAFLAGLLLAEGDLGERTLAQVLPFRELSTAVFFLSLGMLFDAGACLSQGRSFAALLIMFTLGKAVLAGLAARLMKFPLKIAALSGVGLGQFSEFGYVLLQGGLFYKILGPSQTAVILSAGVASMILTPLALRWAPRFLAGEKALAPLERLLGSDTGARLKAAAARTQPDVLLLGWGPEAVGLAAQLARHGLRCLALECDPAAVTSAQDRGEPVAYGDALSPEVLLRAGVAEVRGVVSLLPADLTGQAAASLSRARPGLALLAWVPNSDKKALLFRSRARAQVVDDVHVLVGRLKRDAHGA